MSDGSPHLQAEDWAGPLALLVEQARSGALDLRRMSLLQLIDQLGRIVEEGVHARPLARSADWLVLAATLLQLRSALMLRDGTPERQAATGQTEALRQRALRRAALERAMAAISQIPRLGNQVFGRGGEGEPRRTDAALLQTDLLDACLALLQRRLRLQSVRPALPQRFSCFTVSQALAWWRQHLGEEGRGLYRLDDGLAEDEGIRSEDREAPLQRNAAKAAHFLAALELGKQGAVTLSQARQFGTVELARTEERAAPDSAWY